jgi:hypothetical protein
MKVTRTITHAAPFKCISAAHEKNYQHHLEQAYLALHGQDKSVNVRIWPEQLAFLTPPFLGGFSAEVCKISPHNSNFYNFFERMMVNLLCKQLVYFEKLLFTLF